MEATIITTTDTITVKIIGVLNTDTTPQLETVLQDIDKSKKLVFDFEDVDYITSAGLRLLLIQRKQFSGDNMQIVNVSEKIFEVFKTTGFDTIMPISLAEETASTFIKVPLKRLLMDLAKKSDTKCAVRELGTNRDYSWADIERFACCVAKDLHHLGVRKGSHVGIMGANSIDWIVTFFAIQKLGAIALLVNPNLKSTEVQGLSKIGDIVFLCYDNKVAGEDEAQFCQEVMDAHLSEIKHTYCFTDKVSSLLTMDLAAVDEEDFSEIEVDCDDPAVVIFTSGSTGKPKAVLLSAYNLLNSGHAFNQNYRIGVHDATCLILPLFHIFGLTRILLGTGLAGSTLVLPASTHIPDILNAIESARCTMLCSVPTMLLALASSKDFSTERVDSLRCIVISGASAGEEQIHKLKENFPNAFFATNYGLSEMTPVTMTLYQDSIQHVATTVGKPIKNIQVKIIDVETNREVAQGGTGEILVKGFNTMLCYYKLEIEKQPIDAEGFLHTGDLGMIDADGYIHFVGRLKELIVRGGENIAPREIEEVMLKHPSIAQVKVQGIPDAFYGEVVGACVVVKEGMQFDEADMRAFLGNSIAKYKIPVHFVLYDKFPLLANGKIDAVNLKKDMNAKALGK